MISPAILFNLVTGAIGAFQYFTQAYVVSEGTVGRGTGAVGGTQNSLLFYGLSIYNQAFRYFQLGYASAMAWVLMLIILATTGAAALAVAPTRLLRRGALMAAAVEPARLGVRRRDEAPLVPCRDLRRPRSGWRPRSWRRWSG